MGLTMRVVSLVSEVFRLGVGEGGSREWAERGEGGKTEETEERCGAHVCKAVAVHWARIDAWPGQDFTQGAGACTFGGSKVLLDSWSTSKRVLLKD